MRAGFTKYLLFCLIISGLYACKSTKFIPEGEYLLDKVKIESDIPNYKTIELKPYVRQQPNYKMFGLYKTMFKIYNLSGKDTTKWYNRFIQKIGEEPVIFDSTLVYKTESEFQKLFVNMGYIHADVSSEIVRHNKKADVIYRIQGNTPYRIRQYTTSVSDTVIEKELYGANGEPLERITGEASTLRIPLVKEGMLFERNLLDAERDRLTTLLQNRGYFAFTKENITYDADSSLNADAVDLELKLRILNDSAVYSAGKKFYYDQVFIYLDYDPLKIANPDNYSKQDSIVQNGYTIFYTGKKPSLRPRTLLNNCFITPGRQYSQLREDFTYSAFSSLRTLNNIQIQFNEKLRNDSTLLDCSIFTIPAQKQTVTYAVEGTNTAGDLGVATSVNYTHRNLFRGAEMFNFRLRGAYEAMNNFSNPFFELGGEASILVPKFIFPFIDNAFLRRMRTSTEFSLSYNYQTRPEYDRTLLSGGISYQWQGRNKSAARHQFDIIDIDYVYLPRKDSVFMSKLPPNAEYFGYTNQFIVGSSYTFYHSTFDAAHKQKDAHSFRFSLESAGNALYGLSSLFDWEKETNGAYQSYRLMGTPFAQFVKSDFDYTKSIVFDRQNSIAWRVGGGIGIPYANSRMLPFEKRYYSGGANSVRAWQVRELGPGSYVPNGSTTFYHQSGDIKLDLNIEYRSHFFWKLEAAAFIDAGNIWTIKDYEGQEGGKFKLDSFYKEIAIGYGLGLRLDFDYFLIRFDCGEKAYNPAKRGQDRWTLLHPNFKENFAWHIAVGYPF
ncbi:membrane protein [Bacteroidia bacterium]|nr:membrane protein [Bacteroidia bacterium]